MKQKDIALIIIVIFVSGVISFIVTGKLFTTPKAQQQKVETVDKITSEFNVPDSTYFNKNSIDPTQLIQIGNNNNQNPFSSGQ